MSALYRERIEWCDIWVKDAERKKAKRALFVGDSITRGYYALVEKELDGALSCARCCTSRFLSDPVFFKELDLVLSQYEFDVVHLNNGLHGWDYREKEFEQGLEPFVEFVQEKAPKAKVALATCTPIWDTAALDRPDKRNKRVLVRNASIRKVAKRMAVPVDDLHAVVTARPDCVCGDGVHFLDSGNRRLAAAVAGFVRSLISGKRIIKK